MLFAATALALTGGGVIISTAHAAGGATVSGTVNRADTGAPVGDVAIVMIGTHEQVFFEGRTAADGSYSIIDVADGTYQLRFFPPAGSDLSSAFWKGSDTVEGADILVIRNGASTRVDMTLRIGATVEGTVTRALDGTPVEGVTVWLVGTTAADVKTDAAGHYHAVGLAAGSYTLEFSPPTVNDLPPELAFEFWGGVRSEFLAEQLEVASGASITGIDAALELTGAISGRVTRDGQPVARVQVHFQNDLHSFGWTVQTAADGSYRIAGIPPGLQWVQFWSEQDDLDTWWPGVPEMDGGTLIPVEAGSVTPGVDLAIGGEPAPMPTPVPTITPEPTGPPVETPDPESPTEGEGGMPWLAIALGAVLLGVVAGALTWLLRRRIGSTRAEQRE